MVEELLWVWLISAILLCLIGLVVSLLKEAKSKKKSNKIAYYRKCKRIRENRSEIIKGMERRA